MPGCVWSGSLGFDSPYILVLVFFFPLLLFLVWVGFLFIGDLLLSGRGF